MDTSNVMRATMSNATFLGTIKKKVEFSEPSFEVKSENGL